MPGPLYRQVASKQPRGGKPWLYAAWQVPPADHSLPAEPLWLSKFIFGFDVTFFFALELWGMKLQGQEEKILISSFWVLL